MHGQNKKFGDWGEDMAENFLKKRNYEILEKNFRKLCGEIDIIARKDNVLHFIEVKTRTAKSIVKFGRPEEAVGRSKQRKIIETAYSYLSENSNERNINWQIDVISIVYSEGSKKATISLIDNAFDEN